MELLEGSVKPLSEKLTAKTVGLKLNFHFSVNNAGSHSFKNVQNFEAFEYISCYILK